MKTSALQEFLRSLGSPLAAVGVQRASLDDLQAVARALDPFKDMDLAQLTDFLKRAAEFRQTGVVPAVSVPGLEDAASTARSLSEAVLRLGDADSSQVGEIEGQVNHSTERLQTALKAVLSNFGITPTFKRDGKWLAGIKKKAADRRAAEKMKAATDKATANIRELASQITSPESYDTESVKTMIESLATTEPAILKAATMELGLSDMSAGKKFIPSILARLTGIEAKPVKAPRKPAQPDLPPASAEQVDAMIRSLQEMVARTKDPNAVPDSEIDAILARVSREFPLEQQKGISKQVTGKGGRTTQNVIDLLRQDLTAVKRLLESQKV